MKHSKLTTFGLAALALVMAWTVLPPSATGSPTPSRDAEGAASERAASERSAFERSAFERTGSERARGLRAFDVKWRQVSSALNTPTQVTSAPDGRKRLFVVQKDGQVVIVRDGRVVNRPYIGIAPRVDTNGEGGLLSVAFSPTFRRDSLLWVAYSRRSDGDLIVARMKARSARADRVSAKTLRTVVRVEHSAFDNHYGGQLAFGPNRRLFISTGDGGGSNNTAANRDSLLGKILRINPYDRCGNRRYCVPQGNPFVGKQGRDEVWLMGLRNPWRFSVDKRTDDLWIGDVGQSRFEEINRVGPNPRRIHLGWSCREGRQRYPGGDCQGSLKYQDPKVVVRHPAAQSITGGFVYRGSKYQRQIGGAYVFGDFVTGRIWLYKAGRGKLVQDRRLGSVTSFGVDDRNEIYAVTIGGSLWRMRVTR